MKQSRAMSIFETLGGTALGFAISWSIQSAITWWFNLSLSHADNLGIIGIFTLASLIRGYGWRRLMEAMHVRDPLSAGALAIVAERRRQKEGEGYGEHRDDQYQPGVLALAGASYACSARAWAFDERLVAPPLWPWSRFSWKPTGMRRDLVKSGALILAELERFDRADKRGAA